MSQHYVQLLTQATFETLWMVFASFVLACSLGFPLGAFLFAQKNTVQSKNKLGLFVVDILVNSTRSLPFIILLIVLVPFTRFVVGSSIGTKAAIVPLCIGAVPFIARIVESAFNEIPKGVIEAIKSMGGNTFNIIFVLLSESKSILIRGMTLTLISLIGYSAMAGAVGGGGLGDLAIRYGYQRFETSLMVLTTLILICLVQAIQFMGDFLANTYDRRNNATL